MTRLLTMCLALLWPLAGGAGNGMEPVARGQGYDVYRVAFVGGEPARVDVAGALGSPVELRVYDAERRLVCRSAREEERQSCEWLPAVTAEYWILVRNHGGADISYLIWTN